MSDEKPAHSELGPSGASRWMNCPGSVRLTADIPDRSSGYAAYGTVGHDVSDLCRREGTVADAHLDTSYTIEVDGVPTEIEVDQEMVDAVNRFLEYVNSIPSDIQFFEQRVHYGELVPQWGGGFGTMDDLRINGDLATLTDLKLGKGVQVWAKENEQLMLYALGFLEEHGWLYEGIERFNLVICQPRLDHLDEWEISIKELQAWGRDVVMPAAALTEDEDAPVVPGKWCQFCRIRDRCRARAQHVLSITGVGSSVMDNADLALILPHLDTIRGFANDCERLAHTEISKGSPVGDYKLVEGRSTRAWKDADAAERSARHSYKIKKGELFTEKFISPTQFEKRFGKSHPVMAKYVHKPQGKPALVPGSDPRQPFVVDATEEFADIEQFDADPKP